MKVKYNVKNENGSKKRKKRGKAAWFEADSWPPRVPSRRMTGVTSLLTLYAFMPCVGTSTSFHTFYLF
jgi:antibiotic biosynthesis monooxygenase (ABM) superfamily enzyme